MNWFQKIMYGRYGNDLLNVSLLGFSILLSVILRIIAAFTNLYWLPVFSYLPLFFCIYRMFSRNLSRRSAENQAFLGFFRRVKGFFTGKTAGRSWQPLLQTTNNSYSNPAASQPTKVKKEKGYKYYRCPGCNLHLRVPKGKGKICITCPKCRREFIKKT